MTTFSKLQDRHDNAVPPEYWEAREPAQDQPDLEETACDQIAELWVRSGGDLDQWKAHLIELVNLFDQQADYRAGRIDLCGIVDTWEDDFKLTLADFIRLQGSIRGWIVSHMAAYGRIKWEKYNVADCKKSV